MLERRLAILLLILIFLLLNLGGLVHNTESSLACPDWPLCYGQVFPRMEGGILIEHSHRLLASLVGFITIILAVTIHRRHSDDKVTVRLGWTALVMVIMQGVLGGITVIYKLPTIVSTTHLGLSMIYFCTIVLIHHRLSFKTSIGTELASSWNPKMRELALFSLFAVYTQMILGAFMRHSGAGMSCGAGWGNSLLCMDTTTWLHSFFPSLPQAKLHLAHRGYALVAASLVFVLFIKLKSFLSGSSEAKFLRRYSLFAICFVILQVMLGMYSVATNLGVVPTTLHLGVASLILISVWKVFLILNTMEQKIFPSGVKTKFTDYLDLTKPKLTGLVVVTAFIGLVLAPGQIDFFKAIWSIILITLLVAGAAALNCYMEIDVDGKMERTKNRPLPSGRLIPSQAFIFGTGLVVVSSLLLLVTVNWMTGLLGTLALALYLFAYTPLKQKSYIALFIGAVPGALPPLLGWTAVTGSISPVAICLFAILFFWQLPHFLAISIYLSEDYHNAEILTLTETKGFAFAKNSIFIYTILLAISGYIPYEVNGASIAFRNTAIAFGLIFTLIAMYGFKYRDNNTEAKAWAKFYFYGSLVYLPALLGAMIFLK